ncbi:hypothetical protein HanHA300_Chr10g0359311 [Helianthus annuus]|nr:hypothetical protein HanHA300_Chr10g0359311 [Helianthus annuus]KAJ0529695.1 hypothetical protein HanHA89_Chr10g0380911 [Helianthus annuus]KAJ0696566.1 hypothetical protein HanLR1_Chr10g0358631 [Helianthus annuus]
MIPDEIADLVGKKYAFNIDISNFNVSNNYKSFTVSNLTDDPSIISRLEANLEVFQVNPSDSMNSKSIEFESQDTVNFKDTISSTSDNVTPTSLIVTSNARTLLDDGGVKKNTTHSELKRNLSEVYEIDDSPKQSATKPPPKSVEAPTMMDAYIFCKERRKMRRLYLDRKRSRDLSLAEPVHIAQSFTSVTMPENSKSMAASVFKERRKIRKIYLDSKRSKETSFSQSFHVSATPGFVQITENNNFQQSILQSTKYSRNGSNCKVNITNHTPSPVICTNETFLSPLADIRRVGSGNIQSSISSRHVSKCKENNIKDTSYSCPKTHSQVVATNAVVRSPLSDITKGLLL